LTYEAMLASGRKTWTAGDHVRVYRTKKGSGGVVEEPDNCDLRDYDVPHYSRLLRETYAARLVRAFTPEDYANIFEDTGQLTLFTAPLTSIRTILNPEQCITP
jgi:DNA polymerase, archaea type